jgi:hypothetical protein
MNTRDEFMAFFRSDKFDDLLSVEDKLEVFRQAIPGSSDITKELLVATTSDYDVNLLGLFSTSELLDEVHSRKD